MDGRYREDKAKKHIDRLDFISEKLLDDESGHDQIEIHEFENSLREESQYYNICFGVLFMLMLAILIWGYITNGGIIYYVLQLASNVSIFLV